MPRISTQWFVGQILLFVATAFLSSQLSAPCSGQELRDSLKRELDAIAARLQEVRNAGESQLADQQEERLRQLLNSYGKSMERAFDAALDARKSPVEKSLEVARLEIDRLRNAGDEKTASELQSLLLPIQVADRNGNPDFEVSDEPELHLVTVNQGSTLPEQYTDGNDRLSHGFAEVKVNLTSRPVVLGLHSKSPIKWKLDMAKGVRIHAVVLIGPNSEIINGHSLFKITMPNYFSRDRRDPLEELSGRPIASKLELEAYIGKPIELGPKNRSWLASYLAPNVDAVVQRAFQARQQIGIARLKELRFPATFFGGEPHSSRGPGFSATSQGTYSIAGPIADTLRPLVFDRLRQLIVVEGEERKSFILTEHGQLAVEVGDKVQARNRPNTVPPSAEMAGRVRFNSMAFDARRSRILLSTDEGNKSRSVFYGVKDSKWTKAWSSDHKLYGLTYVPEFDGYYGLVAGDIRNQDQKPLLVKLTANGKVESTTNIAIEGKPSWGDMQTQLVAVENKVIVIGPPIVRNRSTGEIESPTEQLFVINPRNGELEYSGSVAVHDGSGQVAERPAQRVDGTGVLARIDTLVARAKADISSLRQSDPSRAARLETKLDQILAAMRGEFPKRKEPRLHVVGTYEAQGNVVRVTDRSGPVVLVVCAYEESTWTIEADEGVDIQKIIVGGYHQQKVKSSPKGVPVEIYCSERGEPGFQTYGLEDDSYLGAVETLKQHTPHDISTFVGHYNALSKPTIVGPENGEFRSQEIVNHLKELIAEASVDQTTKALAELRKHRFYAVHNGPMPGIGGKEEPIAPGRRRRGDEQRYFNTFNIDGPLIGRGDRFPVQAHMVAFDPNSSRVFHASQHDAISIFNLKTGADEKIEFDAELPRLSWQSGLTFDTKRQRLLLTSHGGGGYLYGYDLKTKEWSVLRKPGLSTQGMVYAEDEDAIYAVSVDMGSGRFGELRKHNAQGAMLGRIPLSKPIQTGRHRGDSHAQISYFPGHLVMIVTHNDHRRAMRAARGERVEPVKPSIFVINVGTGEIVHEGELTPHVERLDLTNAQLDEIWQKLIKANGATRDQLIWDITAGHESAVRFLETQLKKRTPTSAKLDAEVATLAKQLSANKFSEREKAFETLQEKGSLILPQVESLIKQQSSTEAKTRLSRLAERWKMGKPQSRTEIESAIAIDALARIGSVEAKRVLKGFADSGVGIVKHRAKLAVEE